jgi:6-phosphogluconolactonase (cycloisomerase 2 family)
MAVRIRRMLVSAASLVALMLLGAVPAPAATSIASVEVLLDDGTNGIEGGAAVAVSSPDGGFVYVAGLQSDGVAVFSRNPSTGKLTFVDLETNLGPTLSGPLANPQGLALSPGGGDNLYVASKQGVTVFNRDTGTGLLTWAQEEADNVGGVTDLGAPFGIAVSPDGEHVYVTAEQDDSIGIFDRDTGTGALTYVTTLVDPPNLDRPNGLIVSPDGLHVYVANSGGDSLAVYSRNLVSGLLTFVETQQDNVGGVDGLDNAVSVAISPNGASVYAVGESDDGIAVFSRNPVTGALTFVEYELGDDRFVRQMSAIAVSADGTKVFAAGRRRDAVVLFDRNTTSGALDYVAAEKLNGAFSLGLSPDGLHIYSGTRGELGQLGVFRLSDVACSPAPMLGCSTPSQAGASLVFFKDKSPNDGDTFLWKWNKGPVTLLSSFGDPATTTNDLILCAYEDTLGTPTLIFRARLLAGGACAAKPCWKATSTGYKYKDKDRSPDGLLVAGLKAGSVPAQAKIKMKGKGSLLTMPVMPLTTPVVVQLQRTGACWETTHTTPIVTTIDQFKSKDN